MSKTPLNKYDTNNCPRNFLEVNTKAEYRLFVSAETMCVNLATNLRMRVEFFAVYGRHVSFFLFLDKTRTSRVLGTIFHLPLM